MAGYMDVGKAIETAQALVKEKRKLLASIDTVRSDLRHAVTRKETTAEQTKWIEETFPLRERKRTPKGTAATAS